MHAGKLEVHPGRTLSGKAQDWALPPCTERNHEPFRSEQEVGRVAHGFQFWTLATGPETGVEDTGLLHHRRGRGCGLVQTEAKISVTKPERTLGSAQGVRIHRQEPLQAAVTGSVLHTMRPSTHAWQTPTHSLRPGLNTPTGSRLRDAILCAWFIFFIPPCPRAGKIQTSKFVSSHV